jgi:Ca2+:H+ antiporter
MTMTTLRHEWPLLVSVVTALLFLAFGSRWLADLSSAPWFALVSGWLFAVILLSAFAIVRHAESIAGKVGEPLGTLVLTLAVTGIEVMMIAAVMYSGKGTPTLARDAMFAVVMLVLNGMVGFSLLAGGLRFHEQTYNLQGANAFLAVIIPLAVIGLVLPNHTNTTLGPTLSSAQAVFVSIMSLGLYGVFLAMQNIRHREYFVHPGAAVGVAEDHGHATTNSTAYHFVLLAAYLLPLVLLSKQLAVPINYGIGVMNAPVGLAGFLVAVIILSPESLSAARAALSDQLQRSVNILLGSVLATICLTIPAVLVIGLTTHQAITLGLDPADTVLLLLTLVVSMLTFASARTNALLGAVHLLLFLAYLMLIFDK